MNKVNKELTDFYECTRMDVDVGLDNFDFDISEEIKKLDNVVEKKETFYLWDRLDDCHNMIDKDTMVLFNENSTRPVFQELRTRLKKPENTEIDTSSNASANSYYSISGINFDNKTEDLSFNQNILQKQEIFEDFTDFISFKDSDDDCGFPSLV